MNVVLEYFDVAILAFWMFHETKILPACVHETHFACAHEKFLSNSLMTRSLLVDFWLKTPETAAVLIYATTLLI